MRRGAGRHVLAAGVESGRDRIVGGVDVGPVRGECVVGLATEEQVVGLGHRLGVDLRHDLLPVGSAPAARREPARRVLLGTGRALHHAVEGDKAQDRQFTHIREPTRSAPSL